jgi:uncharacterized protein (UPF0335 family)
MATWSRRLHVLSKARRDANETGIISLYENVERERGNLYADLVGLYGRGLRFDTLIVRRSVDLRNEPSIKAREEEYRPRASRRCGRRAAHAGSWRGARVRLCRG